MIYIRKVHACYAGYVCKIGNLEIAYDMYGEPASIPICVPPRDFSPYNDKARKIKVGAYKIDGQDWVVSESKGVSKELVSKFASIKLRQPREVFIRAFLAAYANALYYESLTVTDMISNKEFIL